MTHPRILCLKTCQELILIPYHPEGSKYSNLSHRGRGKMKNKKKASLGRTRSAAATSASAEICAATFSRLPSSRFLSPIYNGRIIYHKSVKGTYYYCYVLSKDMKKRKKQMQMVSQIHANAFMKGQQPW